MLSILRRLLNRGQTAYPADFDKNHIDIITAVKSETMTSNERLFSLIEATRYITQQQIEGDIVECGVWRGGSVMAILHTLKKLRSENRSIYLYDTFDGMTEPTEEDVAINGKGAKQLLKKNKKNEKNLVWAFSGLDVVKRNVQSTGYDLSKVHLVQGKVEETIPRVIPEKISLLRLDTDWYESTKHELEHLFSRLTKGGVLILDDYGHWQGARKAADEYFADNNIRIFLSRMDYTGRIAIKQ